MCLQVVLDPWLAAIMVSHLSEPAEGCRGQDAEL